MFAVLLSYTLVATQNLYYLHNQHNCYYTRSQTSTKVMLVSYMFNTEDKSTLLTLLHKCLCY